MSVDALEMTQVRWHSRGGQGGKTASKLLADACFQEGKQASAFSFYGAERRGAPVTSYNRIAEQPIKLYSEVSRPDYVVVLDSSLLELEPVTEGLPADGTLILNAPGPSNLAFDGRLLTVDATQVAKEYDLQADGTPIVNTPILGAVARTDLVSIETLTDVIEAAFDDANASAARTAYERTTVTRRVTTNGRL